MDAGTELLAAAPAPCASASIARCTSSQMSCCCFLYSGFVHHCDSCIFKATRHELQLSSSKAYAVRSDAPAQSRLSRVNAPGST